VDLWENVQPQGEEHNYCGESSLPLAASRSPEGALSASPYYSSSRRTGDEVPGVQVSCGQRYPISDTRTDSHIIDSPPLGSLLRITRGVAAPPLVSRPPFRESAVHGSLNGYAPSNSTVILERLMLRYQVRGVSRQWPSRTELDSSSEFRRDCPRSLLGDCGVDA